MEGRHFGIRKHLFDYDSVIDKQRQSVYKKRDTILTTLEHQMNENEKIVIAGKNKRDYNDKLSKFKLSVIQSHKNFNETYNRIPTKEELKGIVKSAIEGSGTKAV